MADFKFPCPHCGQRIECDDSGCGVELQCPSCEGELLVPLSPAIGLQVLSLFQASADAQARFRQHVAQGTPLNWALSEELAGTSFAVRSDWKRAPAELLVGFKERLQAAEPLRDLKVGLELEEGGSGEQLSFAISTGGKPSKSYQWVEAEKPALHDVAFSFTQLLPAGAAVFSLKPFEETDTVVYLLGLSEAWESLRLTLSGCFDQLFAAHTPAHQFQPAKARKSQSRKPDWLKLWNEYAGPATYGSPEGIAQSLDILRPMSRDDLFYGEDRALRTNAISFFLHELGGESFESWLVARDKARLPTILYTYATAARLGALWNLYALKAFPDQKLWGHCLGRGFLTWAYFIYAAMGSEREARDCGRLLEQETVREKERSPLNRNQESHYDLAIFLHNGTKGQELNALEPMLLMAKRESWEHPELVAAALKTHAQTRGEQFVHDSIKWTWPATLYAMARRANARGLLPRDNPFLDTPLDASRVDHADPWLEEFNLLESRYRAINPAMTFDG